MLTTSKPLQSFALKVEGLKYAKNNKKDARRPSKTQRKRPDCM